MVRGRQLFSSSVSVTHIPGLLIVANAMIATVCGKVCVNIQILFFTSAVVQETRLIETRN